MLQHLAKRMARREGLTSQRSLLHRLRARITTEVMRRAARMVLRCLPQPPEEDQEEAQAAKNSSDVPPSDHASARAGNPGVVDMPPFHAPGPSGPPGPRLGR